MSPKRCRKCGKDIYGYGELCTECRSDKLTPNCVYYRELELSITVPYCDKADKKVFEIEGDYYCKRCKYNKKEMG